MQTEKQRTWQINKKNSIKDYIRSLKEVPCLDCGIQYPYYVMQFDHVKGTKIGTIPSLVAARRYKAAMLEIEKCEIICSNCHAIRTWQRIQSMGL